MGQFGQGTTYGFELITFGIASVRIIAQVLLERATDFDHIWVDTRTPFRFRIELRGHSDIRPKRTQGRPKDLIPVALVNTDVCSVEFVA